MTIIIVNNVPNMIFRIRFIFGLSIIDAATITEEIAKIIDAISSLIGLSKLFSPVIKLFTLSGVYNSK